jgi:hypothetical protein
VIDCEVCLDKGFVKDDAGVDPCPNCNPDSGYEPGEYLAEIEACGRCDFARYGRRCSRERDHAGAHVFKCEAD